MNYRNTVFVCAVALSVWCVGVTALTAAEAEPVATTSLSGEYWTLWLQLEQGGTDFGSKKKDRFDLPLFLGLRDGKVVVAWFVHPALAGGRVVWLDAASLKLEGDKLRGGLDGRTNRHWGDKNVHYFSYSIDAVVGDNDARKTTTSAVTERPRDPDAPVGSRPALNDINGTFSVGFVDDAGERIRFGGKLTGRILTADETAGDTLAKGEDWPHYYGDGFLFAGPAGDAKLIDDLSLARPVWKSEATIPTGYGSAPDNRYPDRAGRAGNGGGSASPVVADGCVYQFFYTPRGPVGQSKPYLENFIGKPFTGEAELLAKARELFPQRSYQQDAVLNHFRTEADEVLVCMDAATGRTLWRTTFPQRGNNFQTHKHRGHFPVALVAGGVVYQPGTTGRMYAVDEETGKVLWEYPDAQPEAHVTTQGGIDCHAPSPVLVDGVVVFAASGRVHGVDAKTGTKRWERPLWHRTSLLPWTGGDKSLVIASDRDHEKKQNFAVALDAASGEIIWRQPVSYLIDYAFPLLVGDLLVGYSLHLENVKPGENDGLAVLHAYHIAADGLKPAWTTKPLAPIIDTIGMASDGENLYVSAAREAICLKLATGETVARVENVGGARTQTAFLAAGRFIIQPEGRHGSQSFLMLDANPGNFRAFPAVQTEGSIGHHVGAEFQWRPPHTWTTAYANQPIVYPLVDGRLFVRGQDAIYCYDLRKQKP
ncbi:PQQ-binding-like beta-propeller repeat protein [Lignipirellula cremea]|uniref:Outer membrane biogenesis protein BamB n=1 Tax=Lignipirellula cremea TaxID=2528010 RepID=A0A518DXM5_9BACT|nr:PQQ-binding-like beta-propeller repeat protein [Lignipirellula cremea]QDU96574.1 outer membrane biogenesis protein BamB [Lignipirellula cremea]